MTILEHNRSTRPWHSRLRLGVEGGIVVMAVSALAACGGTGPTASTSPSESETASTSATPATTSLVAGRGVSVVEDVRYREPQSADGTGSTVDIYVGAGDEGAPLVVLLHGWGEAGPGRPEDDLGPLGEEIAELGATVFSFGWQTASGFSADSVADLSCMGPFVAARATEFGADPDTVIVVGHSMGAETGSMLAFSTFDLAPSPDCIETGRASSPVAFVGIAGSYGSVGGPLDDDHTRFRVRPAPDQAFRELDADEEVRPGLTAAQLYQLDGYRAIPPVAELNIVLLVGSEDQFSATDTDVTDAFADALESNHIDVEVVVVPGADHDNIVFPSTAVGQETLQTIAAILANIR